MWFGLEWPSRMPQPKLNYLSKREIPQRFSSHSVQQIGCLIEVGRYEVPLHWAKCSGLSPFCTHANTCLTLFPSTFDFCVAGPKLSRRFPSSNLFVKSWFSFKGCDVSGFSLLPAASPSSLNCIFFFPLSRGQVGWRGFASSDWRLEQRDDQG